MKLNLQSLNWEEIKDELVQEWVFNPIFGLIAINTMLEESGVYLDFGNLSEAARCQLMAEACNNAAKTVDPSFYNFKADAIVSAVEAGAKHGWGDDGAFFLETEELGQSSFHDPYGQINIPWSVKYVHPWSGVYRQSFAFLIASNNSIRRLFAEATKVGGALYGLKNSVVERIANRLLIN